MSFRPANPSKAKPASSSSSYPSSSFIDSSYNVTTTFRIQDIPVNSSKEDFHQALAVNLGLNPAQVLVHSFSSDTSETRTATASFTHRPKFFLSLGQLKNLPEDETGTHEGCIVSLPELGGYVRIDHHFRGFTPLSPIPQEDQVDRLVEYDSPDNGDLALCSVSNHSPAVSSFMVLGAMLWARLEIPGAISPGSETGSHSQLRI